MTEEERIAFEKALKSGRVSIKRGDRLISITDFGTITYFVTPDGKSDTMLSSDELVIHQPKSQS